MILLAVKQLWHCALTQATQATLTLSIIVDDSARGTTVFSTSREDWTAARWQLRCALTYAALLAFREHNVYSVDGARAEPIS